MKYSTVLIDLDNTLWDFELNSRHSLQFCYNQYHLGNIFDSFEQFYNLYHPYNNYLWAQYREEKISKEELKKERFLHPFRSAECCDESLAANFGNSYLSVLAQQSALIDGAKELLIHLKTKGYQLIIVSNGFKEVQYQKMEQSGIRSFFSHIVLSDDVGINKPNARIFEYALQQANAPASQAIMIGDDWDADILGAQNAHIDQLYFNRYHTPSNGNATYEVYSLRDIVAIL